MAAAKTWTDGEVLDLVRAVLVVRDAGLMQRLQAVWGGGDSAGLSPLSGFFKGQARWFDLFGFGHEPFEHFWRLIEAALARGARRTDKSALQHQVQAILRRAESVAPERAQALSVVRNEEMDVWLRRQLEGLDGGRA